MKSEQQAIRDYSEISDIIGTLSQRLTMMQYDSIQIDVGGGVRLIETPAYKTVSHNFKRSGNYERMVKSWEG